MKKISVKVMAASALGLVAATSLGVGGVASAAGSKSISIHSVSTSGTSSTECYIYRENGFTEFYTECASSLEYGTYDASTKTLTLGTGLKNASNKAVHIDMESDSTTLKANNAVSLSSILASSPTVLDFGERKVTGNGNFTSDLTIKSGDIIFSELHTSKNVTINGGVITLPQIYSLNGDVAINGGTTTLAQGSVGSAISCGNFSMTDGDINIPSSYNRVFSGDAFSMSGGSITASLSGEADFAFDVNDDFSMTAGIIDATNAWGAIDSGRVDRQREIIIDGGELSFTGSSNSGMGIDLNNKSAFTMNGGKLTLDGYEWGVTGDGDAKVSFNGGETVIKNSRVQTIWLDNITDNDPKSHLVFADGMGIKEDTYVFYKEDTIGIAESGTVTIANGYPVRYHYGWEHIDDPDAEDIDIPNTGLNTKEQSGAEAIMKNVAIVMASLAAIAAGAIFAIRSLGHKVKFTRK